MTTTTTARGLAEASSPSATPEHPGSWSRVLLSVLFILGFCWIPILGWIPALAVFKEMLGQSIRKKLFLVTFGAGVLSVPVGAVLSLAVGAVMDLGREGPVIFYLAFCAIPVFLASGLLAAHAVELKRWRRAQA